MSTIAGFRPQVGVIEAMKNAFFARKLLHPLGGFGLRGKRNPLAF